MNCPFCKAENEPEADTCFSCGRSLFSLTRGTVLSERYEIQATLGRGGMGMVYKAYDRELDETVAIKLLRASGPLPAAEACRVARLGVKLQRRAAPAPTARGTVDASVPAPVVTMPRPNPVRATDPAVRAASPSADPPIPLRRRRLEPRRQ